MYNYNRYQMGSEQQAPQQQGPQGGRDGLHQHSQSADQCHAGIFSSLD